MNDFQPDYLDFPDEDSVTDDRIFALEPSAIEDDFGPTEFIRDQMRRAISLFESKPSDTSPVLESGRSIEIAQICTSLTSVHGVLKTAWFSQGHMLPIMRHSRANYPIDNLRIVPSGLQVWLTESHERQRDTLTNKKGYSVPEREFLPSVQLVEFWVNGIREYMALRPYSEGRHYDEASLNESDLSDLAAAQKAFAIKVGRMFAQIGYRRQSGVEPNEAIADEGKFTLKVQLAILDTFALLPYDTGAFLELLHSEVTGFLRHGGRLRGNWGELQIRETNVVMAILSEPTRTTDYEVAKMIE